MARERKRTTVTYYPPAVDDLAWLERHTGMSGNELSNRGVRALAAIERELMNGGELSVTKDGVTTRLKII